MTYYIGSDDVGACCSIVFIMVILSRVMNLCISNDMVILSRVMNLCISNDNV